MNHLSQQEFLMKWSDFCGKGRRLTQTLAVVASENSMKEKAAPILKQFIDPEIVKVIINIWELMTALTKDIDGQPGTNVVRTCTRRMRAESTSMTLWLEKSEKRFTTFRDAYWVQAYCTPKARVLHTLSAKYVAFAARREPRCTTKNILELTITGKIKQVPIIPDALIAASMGCVLFLHARLREIFGGSDRERRQYVGGDMTIVREVDAQLNDLNKAFPVMAKAWESKLPAINMYAISVAPRSEDRAKETTNRLLRESFIVIHRHLRQEFRRRGDTSMVEDFKGTHTLPQSPRRCVPPSARSTSDTTGRAPWWASYQPTGKERDDGSVVNHTIQAILEISAN